MKKPQGGAWYTPGLLTRYAILRNRQFAGSEDTGSAYVLTTGAYTPEFPEVEETMATQARNHVPRYTVD